MKGKSVREIEEACSGRVAGDLPDSPRDESARMFTVSFELTSDQYARYRAAKELAVKSAESPIDEASAVDAITRRAVFARDRHRCKVPGCNNRRYLQIHHLEHLMHGGTHDLWNLILLCTAHHQAHHAGLLEITGRVGIDLAFKRIDPTPTWASKLSNSVADELSRLTA